MVWDSNSRLKDKTINIGNESCQCIDKFFHLGDMIDAGSGAEASSIGKVSREWKKFSGLTPLLTIRELSLHKRHRLYTYCVRNSVLNVSKTWLVKDEVKVLCYCKS